MPLRSMAKQLATTWRRLLIEHGPAFLEWLATSGREEAALDRVSGCLSGFLISAIEQVTAEWPNAAVEFWNRIPDVRACCSTPQMFERSFAVEAYAYVHFLERYRRMWTALKYLTDVAALPLAINGVRTLDVGAGPAPALYAIDDYYSALKDFAAACEIEPLMVPLPVLNTIERSQGMNSFVHRFSEFCGRRGPFGTLFNDFVGLDLQAARAAYQRQNESEEFWDPETNQYEDIYDPVSAAAEADCLFGFRFVLFSNFLTLDGEVDVFRAELDALFRDMRPGGVVIVLGATGDPYQVVYTQLGQLARAAGLREPVRPADAIPSGDVGDSASRRIKAAQHQVYQCLERAVGGAALCRDKAWPDYWNPEPSSKARPKFGLRVFRRGRWPKRTSSGLA